MKIRKHSNFFAWRAATGLAGLVTILTAVGCSDGAAPGAYRAPLSRAGSGGADATRCDAPGSCFDMCFCHGGDPTECMAVCDESGTGGAGGVAGTGDVGGTGGATGGAAAGGSSAGGTAGAAPMMCTPALPSSANAEFLCEPGGPGACQSCGDCAQVIDGSAKQAAQDCGIQCGGSVDCASSCLDAATNLSAGCSACLVEFFDCVVTNCLSQCIGLDPAACTACTQSKPSPDASCSSALEACSGAQRNPSFTG